MIQLSIEGMAYPEATGSDGSYACEDVQLAQTVEMISGRMVQEVRGTVKQITYTYKYFVDSMMKKCLSDLKSKKALAVVYRIPETNEMQTGNFICTAIPNPSYVFSVGDTVYWEDISFTLREVKPHD